MFLGHLAVGLAAKRAHPRVSLATWFMAVQLVDLIWSILQLLGLEHVRIAPGITAFTPLDFSDYFAAAFGPPPPDVPTLAWSALALWLLVPWARWADR